MKVTIYYKDKPAYEFITPEEDMVTIIGIIQEKYKNITGFKIEKEKANEVKRTTENSKKLTRD